MIIDMYNPDEKSKDLVIWNLTKPLQISTRWVDFVPDNAIVAGGAVLDLVRGYDTPRDVDLYFPNRQAAIEFIELNSPHNSLPDYGDRLSFPVYVNGSFFDIVLSRFPDSIAKTFEDFDLTVCQWAYKNNKIFASPEALHDTRNCEIHLVGEGLHLSKTQILKTFMRLFKYKNKGFNIVERTVMQLAERAIENYGNGLNFVEVDFNRSE